MLWLCPDVKRLGKDVTDFVGVPLNSLIFVLISAFCSVYLGFKTIYYISYFMILILNLSNVSYDL